MLDYFVIISAVLILTAGPFAIFSSLCVINRIYYRDTPLLIIIGHLLNCFGLASCFFGGVDVIVHKEIYFWPLAMIVGGSSSILGSALIFLTNRRKNCAACEKRRCP